MEFWLAPLHGITNSQFRNCLNRHIDGLSMAVTPFLAVIDKAQAQVRKWNDIQPENNVGMKIIPQLIGNKPEQFVDTISALQQFGYQRFNWNIGCPSGQVVRHQRGCGLMPQPDRVEAVVRRVVEETDCRFSVKMRLGLRSVDEGLEIIERLNRYPLDFVAVHPRLGVQQYDGMPDLDTFQKIYKNCRHPLVYSGDITDIESYQKIVSQFPDIQSCMLGRGVLKNIFLAEELLQKKSIPIEEKDRRFKNFYDDFVETMVPVRGEHGTLSNLKELWHYFAHFFQLSPEKLQHLLRINDLSAFNAEAYGLMNLNFEIS